MGQEIEIIDNLLPPETFLNIKKVMSGGEFPWFFSEYVTEKNERLIDSDYSNDFFYFAHLFYIDYKVNSPFYDFILPVVEKINPKSLIRIKGNLYPKFFCETKNYNHVDYDFKHRGAIFYINTNSGQTVLEDKHYIDAVENRLLLFDSSLPHRSSFPTDEKVRININFNFF